MAARPFKHMLDTGRWKKALVCAEKLSPKIVWEQLMLCAFEYGLPLRSGDFLRVFAGMLSDWQHSDNYELVEAAVFLVAKSPRFAAPYFAGLLGIPDRERLCQLAAGPAGSPDTVAQFGKRAAFAVRFEQLMLCVRDWRPR